MELDEISHWLPAPIVGVPLVSTTGAGVSGRASMAGLLLAVRRLLAEARPRLLGRTRPANLAADGASDAELVRLANRGSRLEIDDVRWDFVRSRHVTIPRWP